MCQFIDISNQIEVNGHVSNFEQKNLYNSLLYKKLFSKFETWPFTSIWLEMSINWHTKGVCRILCIGFVFGLPLTPYFKFQFYSQKNQIGPQMLPKKLSHALLMVPSAKLWLEAIYHILVLYWPHTANFISKKSGNLKRLKIQSN